MKKKLANNLSLKVISVLIACVIWILVSGTVDPVRTNVRYYGVKVEVKSDTYYASSELNLRSDASADADLISSVAAGTQLNSTGVCENGWIRVDYNGQTCYASGDFVTTTAPAADAGETAADTSADTSYDESAE